MRFSIEVIKLMEVLKISKAKYASTLDSELEMNYMSKKYLAPNHLLWTMWCIQRVGETTII